MARNCYLLPTVNLEGYYKLKHVFRDYLLNHLLAGVILSYDS